MAIERRSAVVTIYGGDYLDRIRHLEQRAEAAREAAESSARTLDEVPEYLAIAEEHDQLVTEAEQAATHVRVQALPRKEWKALVAAHPPREGNRADKTAGVNEETFADALVPASVVEPDGFVENDLEDVSDVDFDRLYYMAFALNRGMVADPKADLVSRMSQKNDET